MIIDQKKLGDTIEIIAVAPTQETLDVLSKDIKGNISLDINKQVKDQFLKNILTAEGYSLLEKAKESIKKIEKPKLNDLSVDGHLDPKYFVSGEGSGAILLTQDFFNDFVIVPAEDASPRAIVRIGISDPRITAISPNAAVISPPTLVTNRLITSGNSTSATRPSSITV